MYIFFEEELLTTVNSNSILPAIAFFLIDFSETIVAHSKLLNTAGHHHGNYQAAFYIFHVLISREMVESLNNFS
jgi:hypothetical protein